MFNQMVSELKNGIIPADYPLRNRFETAIVKKIGVIKTPYSFWPSDKKINPSSKELLWAAILLKDKENYGLIEAIISSELGEKLKAKGLYDSINDLANKVEQTMRVYTGELIELAPSETFKKTLLQKVQSVTK